MVGELIPVAASPDSCLKLSPALDRVESVPSNKISPDNTERFVPDSYIRKSPAFVESESVPFNWIEPSIIETNPVAALVLDSEVVNVNTSPTSYFVPASSTTIPLIEPSLIFDTWTSATPLPTSLSKEILSPTEYKIPPSETDADATIFLMVKDIDTSWTVEVAVMVSPSENVPVIESELSVNSIIAVPAWEKLEELITKAVAPEVPPVITWPCISEPIAFVPGVVLIVVFLFHSPSEARIIYLFG